MALPFQKSLLPFSRRDAVYVVEIRTVSRRQGELVGSGVAVSWNDQGSGVVHSERSATESQGPRAENNDSS